MADTNQEYEYDDKGSSYYQECIIGSFENLDYSAYLGFDYSEEEAEEFEKESKDLLISYMEEDYPFEWEYGNEIPDDAGEELKDGFYQIFDSLCQPKERGKRDE